jgi:hypothetical protein
MMDLEALEQLPETDSFALRSTGRRASRGDVCFQACITPGRR